MSKMCVVFHECDLDGWVSAAIVKHWWKSLYYDVNNVHDTEENGSLLLRGNFSNEEQERLDFIGYNYGQSIPDLSDYNKVIMCDISFPIEEMEKLAYKLMGNFIWIDHHISAINSWKEGLVSPNGLRNTKYAACELTWFYLIDKVEELPTRENVDFTTNMPEIVRLLGLYDSFRHKNTDEETKVLEFQYGARQVITNYEEAYKYLTMELNSYLPNPNNCDREENPIYKIWNNGKSIYQYLCTEAKQAYKNGFEINFIIENGIHHADKEGGYSNKHLKFICINKERFNPINFGIDYNKDGYDGAACFHYANGMWNFSIYNDNGLVDCSVIAKQYSGGGHFGASGFKLNNEQFLQLING